MPIKHKQSKEIVDKRKKHQIGGFSKTPTQQNAKHLCCINNIMAKFRKTGLIDHIRNSQGFYADVSGVDDFTDAMNIVAHAQQSFETLPAEIRKEFDNDAAEFLDFVRNPENDEKLIELGLKIAPEIPSPAPKGEDPKEAPKEAPEASEEA